MSDRLPVGMFDIDVSAMDFSEIAQRSTLIQEVLGEEYTRIKDEGLNPEQQKWARVNGKRALDFAIREVAGRLGQHGLNTNILQDAVNGIIGSKDLRETLKETVQGQYMAYVENPKHFEAQTASVVR